MRPHCDRCCLRFMLILMDGADRSPVHQKRGTSGSARANASRCVRRLEVAVRRSAGAFAATRQQSYGCAYSDVRWESTSTIFNIITIITIYISHGRCRHVYASGGLWVFSDPKSKFTRHRCCEGQRWDTRWRVLPATTQTSCQVLVSPI